MNKLAAQAAIDFIDTTLQAEIPILRRIDERERSKAHLFELGPSGKQFAVIVGNFDPTKGKFDLQQTRVLLECAPPDLPDVEAMPANDYYNGGSVKRSNSRLAPPRQWSVLVGSETGLRSLLGWYSSTPAVLPRAPDPMSMTTPSVKDVLVKSLPTNTILYGPPGTGKTFSTSSKAVQLCDGFVSEGGHEAVRARFEELRHEGRVSFVTFHQSYGYEEFVEGLRPVAMDGQVVYEVQPGAFKRACNAARLRSQISPGLSGKPLKERTLFKMSLGASWNQEGTTVFDYCVQNNCVLLGWGDDIDFSECSDKQDIVNKLKTDFPSIDRPASQANFVDRFKNDIRVGDIVVVSMGNKFFRAVAEVTGEYEYVEDAPFHQMRAVRWLAIFEGGRPASDLYDRNVVMSSLYELNPEAIRYEKLEALLAAEVTSSPEQPHVLIIDEINRANISKVFGELITLIEPDKREGQANAVTVKLPYSGEDFSVPSNLHLLGTMNTADRSIALLDTALRRRFDFEEVMPQPGLLDGQVIDGVNLGQLLQAMNQRIEVLYDRDHMIGHAYLMNVKTPEDLDRAFRFKILPLLQEYFYENWSQVRRVLADFGDGQFVCRRVHSAIPADGDQDLQDEPAVLYSVNPQPFPNSAYKRIYGADA
ncbi:MAG: AAA family ATPase [Acidovorax defluvii]